MTGEYNVSFIGFMRYFEIEIIKENKIYYKNNENKFKVLLTGLFQFSKNLNKLTNEFQTEKDQFFLKNQALSNNYKFIF